MDILRKIKIIINCKLEFKILKKKNTLVYDIYSAEAFRNYFDRKTTELLDTRYEKVNVHIFIKSFFSAALINLGITIPYFPVCLGPTVLKNLIVVTFKFFEIKR